MTGIMHRAAQLLRGKAEAALNEAEDPEQSLDYAYTLAQQQLSEAQQGLAKMATARKRVELQDQKLAREQATLSQQAKDAVGAGRSDLARSALERIVVIKAARAPMQDQLEQLAQQQSALEEAIARMRAQVDALATKKEVLKAQFAAGTAASEVNESLAGIGQHAEDITGAFTRAEDRVAQVTAHADATGELLASGALSSPLGIGGTTDYIAAELAKSGSGDVDQMLAELEAAHATPALPPASSRPSTGHSSSGGGEMEGWM